MSLQEPTFNHHIHQPIKLDEQAAQLKTTLLKDIKRSAYVYRVDCGGCNGCEIEIFSAITPLFDAERFGIKVVASPRHADILLFTGAVTRAMRVPALRAYESAPDPKICVSYGACGVGGGIFHDLYSVWGGSDTIVPVDVWIPGCPPTPAATIHGFAVALGLLEQKLKGVNYQQPVQTQAKVLMPEIPLALRITVERTARQLSGYHQGREITDRMFGLLQEGDNLLQGLMRVEKWLEESQDPRLTEVVHQLLKLVAGDSRYV